jgi:HJR/Mrr/RecB family endonuclease
MSRRYSSVRLFSRNEKRVFYEVINIVKTLVNIIVAILKAIPEMINYIKKMIKVNKSLKGLGYSYPELMNMIDKITPRQFEIFCAELFLNSGLYQEIELTKASQDYGRDIVCSRKVNGIKEVTFVEVKHYNKDGFQIGRQICQKLLGSCQMLNADKAIIITTGTYHKNAYEVAGRVNNLQLMDITDIEKMILDLDSSQISKIMLRTLNAS